MIDQPSTSNADAGPSTQNSYSISDDQPGTSYADAGPSTQNCYSISESVRAFLVLAILTQAIDCD